MAMVGKVDGEVKDLRFELNKDCIIKVCVIQIGKVN